MTDEIQIDDVDFAGYGQFEEFLNERDTLRRERARAKSARQNARPERREYKNAAKRENTANRPFMAIDGEGTGFDALDRQNYTLLIAAIGKRGADGEAVGDGSPFILERGGRHLTTIECLEFILSLPSNVCLVSFYFSYDITQILRGINENTLRQIVNPK